MRATDGTTRSLNIIHDRDNLVRAFVITSTIAAVTTAAFLLARRAAGAFSDELPAPQLFIVATIALAWTIAVRELSHPSAIIPSIAITLTLGGRYPPFNTSRNFPSRESADDIGKVSTGTCVPTG